MKKLLLLSCLVLFLFSCNKNDDGRNAQNGYNEQGLGASAQDLLSPVRYSTVDVEIQYMPGYQLKPASVANLIAFLEMLCNKPGGIIITQTQIAPSGDTLDPAKVAVLEKQNRTVFTKGGRIGMYILVTDGVDTAVNTLGFAYRNTSICLFGKTIADHSGGPGELSRIALESSTLMHELGHILGLVNTGTTMVVNHEDSTHGKHCRNPDCLMYYAIDLMRSGISNPNKIPALDTACRKDLKANGGK